MAIGVTVRHPRCIAAPADFSVDLVQNNAPVFFIRDPAKFPHLIHTQKRDPATYLNHADDSTMFWDYFSQNHESIDQIMVTMGGRGIAKSWRHMHGYSGHTLKLVHNDSDWVYCQIHMKSHLGMTNPPSNTISATVANGEKASTS